MYNSQGPYLLRAAVPEGVLLALRSLSIHRDSGTNWWREDENGGMSQADANDRPGNLMVIIS